jgi:hypothetical protein
MIQIMVKNSEFERSVDEDIILTSVKEFISNNFLTEKEWSVDLAHLHKSSFNLIRYLQRSFEKFNGEEIPNTFFTTDSNLLESQSYLEKRFGIKLINLQEYLWKESQITLGGKDVKKK